MLNLNLNIIGALQPRIYRPSLTYTVRNDAFKDSIVVAMPGSLFYGNDLTGNYSVPAFDMTNPWDDISAWVRAGYFATTPIGENLPVVYTATGSISPFVSSSVSQSSLTPFPFNSASSENGWGYNGSTAISGAASFVVDKLWDTPISGANISFSSSFVMEMYAAYDVTASYTPPEPGDLCCPIVYPSRQAAWKYDQDGWIWDSNYNGNTQPYPTWLPAYTGSNRFIYESAQGEPVSEYTIAGDTNKPSAVVPYVWKHYALSYTLEDRTVRMYVDGALIATSSIPSDRGLISNPLEKLQVMGAVDDRFGGYNNSLTHFQDFRLYNGTNKNYTGSVISLPDSMVEYIQFFDPTPPTP
jgi:hypothetical protein